MPTVSRRNRRRRKLAAGAAVAFGSVVAPEALAATITVNSTADTVAADGQCTLREALLNANDNAATSPDCTAGSGADTIDFSLTLPATITLGGTMLSITDPVTIDGPGRTDLTISGNDLSRIFTIEDTDSATVMAVTIQDMTLTDGNTVSEVPPGGGAIYNAENLTITNVALTSNEAAAGGAIYNTGCGCLVEAQMTMSNCSLTGNLSAYGGAILSDGTLVSITGSDISNNESLAFGGGILHAGGSFQLTDTTVTGNIAPVVGGIALYAVYPGTTLTNATITGNTATSSHAGGLYFYSVLDLTIEDSVISGNEAAAEAGGIKISYGGPTIIRDTTISGNVAGSHAGGLYLYGAESAATLERVRVTGNTATLYAGGIAAWGLQTTIIESEISGNEAAVGGGLYAGYGAYLYMVNTTVANNTATTGNAGGIGLNDAFAAIDVSTISGNSAPAAAGGNMFLYASTLYLSHTIVADGTAVAGNDLVTAGSSTTANWSLIEDTTGATFGGSDNIIGVDPQLGPLQNNGGPTQTMKPAVTSPAVNSGAPGFTTPANDQRGFPRPVGIVDRGAVELQPGVVGLSTDAYSVNEADGVITITVNRTGGSDGPASVNYTTSSGSAIAGSDFVTTSGTLNWADNDAAPKTFNIPIANDTIFEGNEQFNVTLDTPVNASLGTSAAVVTIIDNDPQPTFSINDAGNITEGNAGTTPANFTVTLSNPTTQTVTIDYNAVAGSAASGTDFTATNGTLTFNPLVTSLPLSVPVIGDTIDETDETFTVGLFNGVNATPNDFVGSATITDDDTATIAIGNVSQVETDAGTTAFVFDVTLSTESAQTITVDYVTSGVSATSGTDFVAAAGTVTFNPGVTAQTITVLVNGDTLDEPNETFNVTLSNPVNATILTGTGTGTIVDDDGASQLTIADVALAEGDAGTTNFVFNVTLAPASGQLVTVDYSTTPIEATSGVDFNPTSGTLTFNPGVTSQQVTVQVNGDLLHEINERFNVTLSNPNANATIADDTGIGTINNDDVASIAINDVNLPEGNAGTTNFVFNVTLTRASSQTITVDYTTQNGTALAGSDYTTTAGTLTFNPGVVTQNVSVPVAGDTNVEPDETFTVVLSNATVGTIFDNSGTGTIANDDLTADLGITKAVVGTGPFVVGQNATFTITINNAGPGTATNVHVLDPIPAGTSFVSATPSQGTCTGTVTIDCNIGTLANAGNATITLVVNLTTAGTVTNTATATSDTVDPTPAAGSAQITVAASHAGEAIPTLNEWMLIALASALAAAAALKLRP